MNGNKMTSSNNRHRTFGSHKKKASKKPVTFDIFGYNEEEDKEYTATFTARPSVPGMAVLEFAAAGAGENSGSVAAVYGFFQKALVEEEYARFMEFVEDPNYDVDLDTLVEIIGFLVEEYASRPTQAS